MESILDLKRLTTQDYCGCILSGDYSVELKKRVAETIDQYRIFEETGNAAILYIAAWQGEKEKIWYERTAALTKLNEQLKQEISERKMDCSGYPQGLAGEEILLEARILCVADVVESIESHRPYRPGLGIDKALEEISKNRGILYDPDAVDACLKLFKEKNFQYQ